MTDKIATILIIALVLDVIANVARLISVEMAVKRQACMFKAESSRSGERIEEAAELIESIVRMTIYGMTKPETSECSKCPGNGIDCADECVKPREEK